MADKHELILIAEQRIERKIEAVEHPAHRLAMEQLKALAQIDGSLKIITNVPDPKAPAGIGPRHPHFFIAHDVVRIEGPDHNGSLWAYSREGDICTGNAHQLLGRLTQHGRAAPFSEDREAVAAETHAVGIQARPDAPKRTTRTAKG